MGFDQAQFQQEWALEAKGWGWEGNLLQSMGFDLTYVQL